MLGLLVLLLLLVAAALGLLELLGCIVQGGLRRDGEGQGIGSGGVQAFWVGRFGGGKVK